MKNKFLLFAAGFGILLIVIVLSAVFGSNDGISHKPMAGLPEASEDAAADASHNTLLAIEAKITEVSSENDELRTNNDKIIEQNKKLYSNFSTYQEKVRDLELKLKSTPRAPARPQKELRNRLADYEKRLGLSAEQQPETKIASLGKLPALTNQGNPSSPTPTPTPTTEQKLNSFVQLPQRPKKTATANPSGSIVWMSPQNRPDYDPHKKPKSKQAKKDDTDSKIKRYTISPLATGFDGVAVTALVGRIPVNGRAKDPYRVKIQIGKDNLAANGYYFDDIAGMFVGGWAKGDWNLTCVSVQLDSYLFVFEDGTIVSQEASGNSKATDSLGYISMPNGFPCIPGDFHSNAPSFLAQQMGLAGLGAAGEAFASSATTNEDLPLGGSRTEIDNTGDYVLGKVASSAVDESLKWILERQQNSFDAVVAMPGTAVSVHFEKTIEIDYDLKGRKVRHEDKLAYQHVND